MVDNIQGEILFKKKVEKTLYRYYMTFAKKTGIWPEDWKTSMLIPIPKKASLKCADHRAIALISHASKVMLKILQRRITTAVESVLDDCQAGLRAGRSTEEQATNLRILCEKYIEHGSKVFRRLQKRIR